MSRFFICVVSLALLAGVGPAVASCTVFTDRDFRGAHWSLGPDDELQMGGPEPMGKTGSGQIYYQPGWNDKVSSFRVSNGCTLTLYQHAGTSGYGKRFTSDQSYSYVGDRWNDQASWASCSCPLTR